VDWGTTLLLSRPAHAGRARYALPRSANMAF